ncbi:MAG: hypothetical protein QXN23_01455 [Candidatus Caldarchaeum sp.]|nr:hypothetical protein [Candidatus Caldarchaeales archaeon]
MRNKQDYEKFIEEVFDIHRDIRYAELFDSNCKRLGGGMRPGVASLDPPEVSAEVDVETAKFGLLLLQNRTYYGELDHVFASMEKVNVIVLPVGDKVLVVALDPPTGLDILPQLKKMAAKISQFLK